MSRIVPTKLAPGSLRLEVGEIIDRRYRLKREIARGGAGAVFEAEHLYTTRPVAIKLLRDDYADRPQVVKRFLQEARSAAKIVHPGIVTVYECGHIDARRADCHSCANHRIEHPTGDRYHDACRPLYAKKLAGRSLLYATHQDLAAKIWMIPVVDFQFLPDMGRMNGQHSSMRRTVWQ